VRCPNCGERDTRVIDSRDLDDSVTIRRRRECAACSTRFTTYERIESARLTVIKRSGLREDFDRSKLVAGLGKALKGRPVPADAAESAADEIEATLRSEGINEVPSSRIGEMALDRLRKLDHIAYVFFASVYQSFDDLERLKREVDRLYAERLADAPGQTSLELVPAAKRAVPPIRTAGSSRRSARR
jgi:transcriptional repressor NrdR